MRRMPTTRNVALRPMMRGTVFSSLVLLLMSFVRPSAEETLSCGATTFQVTFEPSRPSFGGSGSVGGGSAFGAATATTGGGGGTAAASSATASAAAAAAALIQGPTQTAKYTFRALPQLVAGVDVCNISAASAFGDGTMSRGDASLFAINAEHQLDGDASVVPAASAQFPVGVLDSDRMIITRCDNCTLCPHELPAIHRLLSRVAVELGLQSLLVIVQNVNGGGAGGTGHYSGVSSSASSREAERLKLTENTITKFVFLDGEPAGQLSFCELIAEGVDNDALKSFSKTSVLFVSISFIILMVISLAWLVFYYVQRFRYAHAKDRLQRRLFNAAKKALTRIPTRPVRAGDRELDTDCPVCIDPYRTGDIVRMLPCRHIFHKSCVDPWLLEHRTCPMCKSDILKAFGYHVSVNNSGSVGSGNGGGGNTGGSANAGATNGGGGSGAGSRWGRAHFSGQVDADDIVPPPPLSVGHRHAHSRRNCGGNVPTAANASRRHYHNHHHHHIRCGTAVLDKEGSGATSNVAADDTRSTGSSVDADHYPASLMVVNEMIQHHHRPDANETSLSGKSTSSKMPQLVQVIHSGNAKGFSIIPLTVHNTAVSYAAAAPPSESVLIGPAGDSQSGGPKNVTLTRIRTGGSAVARRHQLPRGHVVNLVHLRSRSLNHAQFPAAMSLYASEDANGERSCSGSGTHVCVSPQSAVDEAAGIDGGMDRRLTGTSASTPTALFRTIVSSNGGMASSGGTTGMIPITSTSSTPTVMSDALCSQHSLPDRQPSLPTPQQLHRLSAPQSDGFPFDAYDSNKPADGSDVIFPLFNENPQQQQWPHPSTVPSAATTNDIVGNGQIMSNKEAP